MRGGQVLLTGSPAALHLTQCEVRYGLIWPGGLPAPVVDADTATYKDLLLPSGDMVDLAVTALKSGFTHAIVLREPPKGCGAG